jgi:DNA-binding NarL/FixJ family response regulator
MGKIDVEVRFPTINVYLVAEHRLLREPLVRLLQKREICVVGASRYLELTAEQIATSQCEILLLDSPTTYHALSLVDGLLEETPHIKVVAFGMDEDPASFLRLVSSGISGYVLKDASAREMVEAIRGVAQGEAICPPKLCKLLFELVTRELRSKIGVSSRQDSVKFGLTHRQRELAALVAKGLSNKEIATNLNLSEFTVKNHIHRIMRQVEAENRYEAVDVIRANGLLPSA